MPIVVNLQPMLEKKGMDFFELQRMTEVSEESFFMLMNGKCTGMRFATIDKICTALECKPGDLLDQVTEGEYFRMYGNRRNRTEEDIDKEFDKQRSFSAGLYEDIRCLFRLFSRR